MPAAIDPPIIVTGGGGDTLSPSKKPARNVIQVDCDPADPKGPKRFRTKVNKDAEIKSVMIEFPDMLGQRDIIISGYDVYNIKITFNTGPAARSIKSKPPKARKGKKAAAKRPATLKKSR